MALRRSQTARVSTTAVRGCRVSTGSAIRRRLECTFFAGGVPMSELRARLLAHPARRGRPIYGAAFQLLRCGLEDEGEARVSRARLADLTLDVGGAVSARTTYGGAELEGDNARVVQVAAHSLPVV